MPFSFTSIGMVNALGSSPKLSETPGLSPATGYLDGGEYLVGKILEDLKPVASRTFDCRLARISQAIYRQIEPRVEELKLKFGPDRIAVVLGSSTSGIGACEDAFKAKLSAGAFPREYDYKQQEIGSVSGFVAELAGVSGPHYTVSTACTSSAKVFASARNLLANNICDAVIVGGVDSLCELTVKGFHSLELVTKGISNPFSKNRSGLNIGEGGCFFTLEKKVGGIQLLGVGESSDAYHVSAPDPEAKGAKAAITAALLDARVAPSEISYINLHGTGTIHNDQAESKAINSIFGESVPCSSTKPLVGHLLGAAGATEVGFCYLSLISGIAPIHRFDGEYDPLLPRVKLVDRELPIGRTALSTSFAFGGSNCAVIVGAMQ